MVLFGGSSGELSGPSCLQTPHFHATCPELFARTFAWTLPFPCSFGPMFMCSKTFLRESWSWSSFFSSSGANFQRTTTICAASLLGGDLGRGHRLLLSRMCKNWRSDSKQLPTSTPQTYRCAGRTLRPLSKTKETALLLLKENELYETTEFAETVVWMCLM